MAGGSASPFRAGGAARIAVTEQVCDRNPPDVSSDVRESGKNAVVSDGARAFVSDDTGSLPRDGTPDRNAGQIALPFAHRPVFDDQGFVPARSNAAARAWLFGTDATERWPEGRLLLWGARGRGKSHLLHLWAQRYDAAVIDGAALSLLHVEDLVDGPVRPVAIDGVEQGNFDEIALLQVLNMARERRMPVLLTARDAPMRWRLKVPDLASRIRATMAIELKAAEDVLLRRLMLRLLADRQLAVGGTVTDWLLRRLPREAGVIEDAVRRMDQASLRTGLPMDRSSAAALLDDLLRADDAQEP